MNSIWNKNLELFYSRFPDLYNLLNDFSSIKTFDLSKVSYISVQTAKNGEVTAAENGKLLHSLYNPSREAHNAVFTQEVESKSAIVFYGMGLGYHLVEAAKLILQNGNSNPRGLWGTWSPSPSSAGLPPLFGAPHSADGSETRSPRCTK